jgi:hypothetical protein
MVVADCLMRAEVGLTARGCLGARALWEFLEGGEEADGKKIPARVRPACFVMREREEARTIHFP